MWNMEGSRTPGMFGTMPYKVPDLSSPARSLSTSCHLVELVVGAGEDVREKQGGKKRTHF